MRKGLTTLLVILLVIGAVLVSCKAEVGTPADELVSASFELDSSRALSATLESFNPDAYYWKYAASKNEADTSGLHSGETAGYDISPEAREAGAQWIHENVTGLDGVVPGFSQGLWDFTLYAYKDAEGNDLVYQGEATAVTLVKGGTNMVHVVVSPAPTGTGTLFIGSTSLTPRDTHDSPTVSRFPKVEDLAGHEYAPTSGTTYELEAGTYKVTITYKSGSIVYAEGTVIATVYPGLTTTVTGSVDELVTYAQFEAERNPDIIFRTAEADGIKVDQLVETGSYTLEDTAKSETVAAVVTATVPKEAAWALITEETTDPSATMSLALNVDTVDSTSTSVTYEIGMTKTITVDGSMPETSDVTALNDYVIATVELSAGLTGVKVTHDHKDMTSGEQWAEAAGKDLTPENFIKYAGTEADPDEDGYYYYYEYTEGTTKKATLYIKTNTFSPFQVTYDGETAGVAEVNGVKYATLKAAVEAAKSGDTVKLLSDAEGDGMSINKSLTIDLNTFTYTGTKDPAGSTGTKTQLFQLLKDNTVTIKNGKLTSTAGSGIKRLVQNYSSLTLTDVILDGSNLGEGQYTLSNNSGVSSISGATSIIAPPKGIAFDVCSGWGGYTSCTVNLNTTVTISGAIEVSDSGENTVGVYLNIEDAVFSGDIIVPEWTDKIHINKVCYNADTNVWYDDLQAAINATTAGDTIVLLCDLTDSATYEIDRSIILNGNSHTVNGRLNLTGEEIRISNLKMINSSSAGRCIDTRGSLKSLILEGVDFLCTGTSGYIQPVTISYSGDEPNDYIVDVTISDSKIKAIDNNGKYHGYAVILWTPVNLIVENSDIEAWAAIYSHVSNATINVIDSKLVGVNENNGSSDAFATIVFDGNALWNDTSYIENNSINVSGSTEIIAKQNGVAKQRWLSFQYGASQCSADVIIDSTTIIHDGTSEKNDKRTEIYWTGNGNSIRLALSNSQVSELRAKMFTVTEVSTGYYLVTLIPNAWYSNGPYLTSEGMETLFVKPLESGWMDNGEGLKLLSDITLGGDVLCQMTTGSMYLELNGNDIEGGKIIYNPEVSIFCDVNNASSYFDCSEEGYCIVVSENPDDDGFYKYSFVEDAKEM